MKYLNEQLLKQSFLRLRQTEAGGKKGLERTSGLMIFLAFDALLKKQSSTPPLDLDPESFEGKGNRDALCLEFERLLYVKNSPAGPYHVANLGELAFGEPSPAPRLSANFLTVPVKKGTTSSEPYVYPSRPKPLLRLGTQATHMTWGIDRHPDWRDNLPAFPTERKTRTPFHDLACFVLRQKPIPSTAGTFQEALTSALKNLFTPELCAYWATRLAAEKIYWSGPAPLYQDTLPDPFANHSWLGGTTADDRIAQLELRVQYLEGLLQMHHLPFETTTPL